ncbi:ABC transporter permease, partial [Cronobacter malonaticus]|nr:ABC transporter permease [Cronobacter malonaticus]
MRRLNPVNQARWARFRHNRRGYWSLWIFAIIFALSLGAELIANDKPLAVHYQDRWYFPLIHNYSESDFGGPLATPADYQDPWLQQRLKENGWVLWAPVRFSGTAINFASDHPFPAPPSASVPNQFCADGGDVLARI